MTPPPPPARPAAAHPAPPRFHLSAKPSGSTCNLDCTYCFFLSKEALYPNDASLLLGVGRVCQGLGKPNRVRVQMGVSRSA
jgi:sulfatase maturation enzyme AslB (radical SAM superfamily)